MSIPEVEPIVEVILFHSPNCGHCNKMAPAWKELESMVGSNVKIKKIDTAENPQLAEYFGVQGVPHIVKTEGAKQSIYRGDRTAKDLYNFAVTNKLKAKV